MSNHTGSSGDDMRHHGVAAGSPAAMHFNDDIIGRAFEKAVAKAAEPGGFAINI